MRAVGRQGCSQATATCVQLLSKHHLCAMAVLFVLGTVQNKCSLQYLEDLVCAMRAVGRQGCSQATAICVQLLSKHHLCAMAVLFVLGTVQNKCSLQYLEDLVCAMRAVGRQGCSQATAICVQLLSKHHSCDIAVLSCWVQSKISAACNT